MKLESEDLYEFLLSRRSIREFRDTPVSEAVLRRMLHAACYAPSAHNRQPWRFVIVEWGETRAEFARAMSARYRSDLSRDDNLTQQLEERIRARETRLIEAPALIVLCMTTKDMNTYPDDKRTQAERSMTIQSVALAGMQLLLAVHAEGLGACWMGAPLFAQQEVRDSLQLEPAWEPQAMFLIGEPLAPGEDRGRRSLEEVVLWR
ncbi:MAG TPA: nitroreductase family protein [Anaerolineae bacterium]|nr:nitroreductase family protein [Anaerolineae bacterium]